MPVFNYFLRNFILKSLEELNENTRPLLPNQYMNNIALAFQLIVA